MKVLLILTLSQLFVACFFTPNPAQNSRPVESALSDVDNLEALLLNEQQSIYETRRQTANTDSLRLGMPKNRVRVNMGLPTHIEVAGNPKYENERWIYEKSIPTIEGYYSERHVIYFESGNVVGWESD